MPWMEIERRAFLRATAVGALTLCGPTIPRAIADGETVLFLSACMKPDGRYAIAAFNPAGTVVRTWPLPGRGHSFAVSPDMRRAVAFARHPRNFAVAFDVSGTLEPTLFAAPEGRHFYGHGTFVADGRLLLTTENDYDAARGVVGVYDAGANYRRVGEFESRGVGPHELVMLPDNRTVAVANGGIETHPDAGDAKLNIATMSSSLAFLDVEHGELLAEHTLDPWHHQLSIRHLDVDGNGSVWFGCQYQGPATDQPPLIGRARADSLPTMIEDPPTSRTDFQNYVGSVAASTDGSVIAAASPRAGKVLLFTSSGDVLGSRSLVDGCGLAPAGESAFVATSGTGRIVRMGARDSGTVLSETDLAFDNHIAVALA